MKRWTIIISFIGILLSSLTVTLSAETALKIVNVAVPVIFPVAGATVYRAHHFIEVSSNSTRSAAAL